MKVYKLILVHMITQDNGPPKPDQSESLNGTTTTIDLAVIYTTKVSKLEYTVTTFLSHNVHFDHKLLQHWDHVTIVETSKHKIIPPYE